MKTFFLSLLCCTCLALCSLAQPSGQVLLRQYQQTLPFEKLYVHTDQSVYEPGDLVWFSAYLMDDHNHQVKDWINVQLLDPQGQPINAFKFGHQPEGYSGCIPLGASIEGGVYTLRATTQWALNFGTDAIFEKKLLIQKTVLPRLRLKLELDRNKYQAKERVVAQLEALNNDNQALSNLELQATPILGGNKLTPIITRTNAEGKATIIFLLPEQVPGEDGLLEVKLLYEGQSESIARSIPLREEQVKLWFFPEGGDLVAGFTQKIAFKCLDTLGNSIDGRGTLYTSQHQPLLQIESFHKGMGTFELAAQLNERYYVRLEGQKDTFFLPLARVDELALRVGLAAKDSLPLWVWKRNPGFAELLLRSKDSIVWQQKLDLPAGGQSLKLPITALPAGIAQVVLLDEEGKPYAERLVFVNQHRQAYLQIKTQQDAYLPTAEVKIEIEAHDETGKPLDGNFSLAVVDDLYWTNADDKQDNILSRLLLSAELKGKIDEPAFYFKPNEPKVPAALDLVMLTHGWRKFRWKEILAISHQYSDTLVHFSRSNVIKGQIRLHRHKIRYRAGEIWIEGQKQKMATDSVGWFAIELPTDNSRYPLTLNAKSKGLKTSREIEEPLIPKFKWPDTKKTAYKGLDLKQAAQVVAKEHVNRVGAKNIEYISPFEFGGRTKLQELIVVGYNPYQTARMVSAVTAGTWGSGIGDNLVLGTSDFDRGNSLYLHLEAQPYFYWDEDLIGDGRYGRIFADFGKTVARVPHYQDKTIFWASQIVLKQGKATLQFRHNNKPGTFRMILEGITEQTLLGRTEATYVVQKELELSAQAPRVALSGDTLFLEARLKNRSETTLNGTLHLTLNEPLECLRAADKVQKITLPPDTSLLLYIPCVVKTKVGEAWVHLEWTDDGKHGENWSQSVNVQRQGFQHELARAGNGPKNVFRFPISQFTSESLSARFHAYPGVYQQMLDGLKSIIQEPHGCFEQVSSSNYPSIMALQLLNESGKVDFDFQKKALDHLRKGYRILVGYAVPGGGFSYYGHAPAYEHMTAYGLLQFWDMHTVFSGVDMQMFEKNLRWLLSRKEVHQGQYAEDPCNHLFTLYALSEFRPNLLQNDLHIFEKKEQAALAHDPYLLAMLLSAYANIKDSTSTERLQQQLKQMFGMQAPGKFKVRQTFNLSDGKNVQTETAAWMILALCKAGQHAAPETGELVSFLYGTRNARGGFGSTQGTVIALKALRLYHQKMGNAPEPGTIQVRVNDTWLDTLHYEPAQTQKLYQECGQWLQAGLNEIEIVQSPKQSIPFLFEASWFNAELTTAQIDQPLGLNIQYSASQLGAGDFVRLSATLKNQTERSVAAPMVILGLPAGLSLQNWQLLDMEKKRLFDHFEVQDNFVILYFESLDGREERNFHFDLKATQTGAYQSPHSAAYPYYNADAKTWTQGSIIHIFPSQSN